MDRPHPTTMRPIIALFLVLATIPLTAQPPQAMNYQAVVRNAQGEAMPGRTVTPKFDILLGGPLGPTVYSEDHAPPAPVVTTNEHGLFSVRIGEGYVLSGDFTTIDWSAGNYWLSVSIDTTGGLDYVPVGSQQLVSVPYAFLAGSVVGGASDTDWTIDADTVDSGGKRVGIGTSSPRELLDVAGDILVNGMTVGTANAPSNRNVAVGENALGSVTTAYWNTAVGRNALGSQQNGFYNVAIGTNALAVAGFADRNTAVGVGCLSNFEGGSQNTGIGMDCLLHHRTGSSNTALGHASLGNDTSGTANVAIGVWSMQNNSNGINNAALGTYSLRQNTTGYGNVGMGMFAVEDNQTGFYRTGIGYDANSLSTTQHNNTGVGHGANPTASNQVRLGDPFVNSIGGQVSFSTFSDERFKMNVRNDEVVGLDFILALKPCTYNYDIHAYERWVDEQYGVQDRKGQEQGYAIEAIRFSGFLAQEVEKTAERLGYQFSGVDPPESEKDTYALRYAEFVVPLVKAVQEQQAMISSLESTVLELQEQLRALSGSTDH